LAGKPDNRRRPACGARLESRAEVSSGNPEQRGLAADRLHAHARTVVRRAVEVVSQPGVDSEIRGYLPTVFEESGIVVLMVFPVLQDSAVLKSAKVLLGRRKQEEILRKSVDRAGEVSQQHLRGVDVVGIQTAKVGCCDR